MFLFRAFKKKSNKKSSVIKSKKKPKKSNDILEKQLNIKNATEFDLCKQDLSINDFSRIIKYLEGNHTIHEVKFSNINDKDTNKYSRFINILCEINQIFARVKNSIHGELDLSNLNLIGTKHIDLVPSILEENYTIKKLDLSSCSIREKSDFKAIKELVNKCKKIECLNLNDNTIGLGGIKKISNTIKGANIKHLYLNNNLIKDSGLLYLLKDLNNSSIKTLLLGGNKLTSNVTKSLMIFLGNHQSVEKLYLANNNLGDDGVKNVLAGICHGSKMKELNLSANNVNNDGFKPFPGVLKNHKYLKKLIVGNNNLNDDLFKDVEYINDFYEFVKNNDVMTNLYCNKNKFTDKNVQKFKKALNDKLKNVSSLSIKVEIQGVIVISANQKSTKKSQYKATKKTSPNYTSKSLKENAKQILEKYKSNLIAEFKLKEKSSLAQKRKSIGNSLTFIKKISTPTPTPKYKSNISVPNTSRNRASKYGRYSLRKKKNPDKSKTISTSFKDKNSGFLSILYNSISSRPNKKKVRKIKFDL